MPAEYWLDNKCTRCGTKATGPLEKLTCPTCSEVGCPNCGPVPGAPFGLNAFCKMKCVKRELAKAHRMGPPSAS